MRRSDMLSALDNFISADPDAFMADPSRLGQVLAIIHEAITSEHLGEEDRARACILMEAILLSLRGRVDAVRLRRCRPGTPRSQG